MECERKFALLVCPNFRSYSKSNESFVIFYNWTFVKYNFHSKTSSYALHDQTVCRLLTIGASEKLQSKRNK
jgi:hypothetical protein